MNLPTKSFTPAPRDRAARHIAEMFAVLEFRDDETRDVVTANFLDAVALLPEWAIAEASRAFRHGEAGGGKFAPKPGEFAIKARQVADRERSRLVNRQRESDDRRIARQRREMLESRKGESEQRKAFVAATKAKYGFTGNTKRTLVAPPRKPDESVGKSIFELSNERFSAEARAALTQHEQQREKEAEG